jgi:hypothetical protein
MGNLTTFTVYNDYCDEIPKNAKEFADLIYEACQSHKVKTLPIAQTICQKTRHANDKTFYAHAGNTVVEINYFSQDTIEMLKRNPEFFKEILDDMAYHVRELRKEYKRYNPPKTRKK